MSERKIDSIVEELKSEEVRLKSELDDLKRRAQEVTKDLKTVQGGLAGLSGKTTTTRKRSTGKKRGSQDTSQADSGERLSEMALQSFP